MGVSGARDVHAPPEKGSSGSSSVSKQQSEGMQQSTAVDPSLAPLPKEKDVSLGTSVLCAYMCAHQWSLLPLRDGHGGLGSPYALWYFLTSLHVPILSYS